MIHEVDAALRGVIADNALRGSGVEVALEAPTKEWAARHNAPTVNAYLYDVHEDLARREVGVQGVRDQRGAVTAQRRPPRWYRLSYLVTAWTARAEDEHRLLSAVLGCLMRTETLPAELLGPALSGTGLPVPLAVAMRGDRDRPVSELWTALGGQLKPSLDVVITAPFPLPDEDAAPVALELEVRATSVDGTAVDAPRRAPRDGSAVAGTS
ncbi:hypothetical protein BIV57_08900 [Mangrovactinospora gilvigrisea]|uniref:Pvc16 N-terminal domain-containing protein n=1 Tax=Mangrovactinospora gilvigrisea TaxID=1428644 RepID=A0A1J7BH20_9ACTN|nr:DUF4255 domain-containing protein [Mangrovactinospora gilvigrisea]OIV37869.1 hypothetical protein BIV57_08900 [Mangrovactinospora gilvigrisea]